MISTFIVMRALGFTLNVLTLMGLSLAIGLLIGLERERNPSAKAGLRTFALVALLGTLAAMLSRVDLLVTNDSGPSHVAWARGVPSVVLFGPTDPVRWAPLDRRQHRVVVGIEPGLPLLRLDFVLLEQVFVNLLDNTNLDERWQGATKGYVVKDDAKEVATGTECGLVVDGFTAFEPGDIIEAYRRERVG